MKKIINGKAYNTETSKFLAQDNSVFIKSFYVTRQGEFFSTQFNPLNGVKFEVLTFEELLNYLKKETYVFFERSDVCLADEIPDFCN